MSATNYLTTVVLNKVLRGTNFELDTTFYLALFINDPSSAGELFYEVDAPEYTRVAVTFDSNYQNTATLTYPISTSSWGTITHAGICTTFTDGYLLIYGAVTPNAVVGATSLVRIETGNLVVSMA